MSPDCTAAAKERISVGVSAGATTGARRSEGATRTAAVSGRGRLAAVVEPRGVGVDVAERAVVPRRVVVTAGVFAPAVGPAGVPGAGVAPVPPALVPLNA